MRRRGQSTVIIYRQHRASSRPVCVLLSFPYCIYWTTMMSMWMVWQVQSLMSCVCVCVYVHACVCVCVCVLCTQTGKAWQQTSTNHLFTSYTETKSLQKWCFKARQTGLENMMAINRTSRSGSCPPAVELRTKNKILPENKIVLFPQNTWKGTAQQIQPTNITTWDVDLWHLEELCMTFISSIMLTWMLSPVSCSNAVLALFTQSLRMYC